MAATPQYKTPGVYILEENAFPNAAVAVETGIPAFIGFTEKTEYKGESYKNKAVRISSLEEFKMHFGEGFQTIYNLSVEAQPTESPKNYDLNLNGISYGLTEIRETKFYLYDSIRFFYQNRGEVFYLISVGTYADYANDKVFSDTTLFTDAIDVLKKEFEPTMIIIPDAVLFDSRKCRLIQNYMLAHCGTEKNKIAILDIHEGYKSLDDINNNPVQTFRNQISSPYLSYGAAYYPWLNTNVVDALEITYKNLDIEGLKTLKSLCESAVIIFNEDQKKILTATLESLLISDESTNDLDSKTIHGTLVASIPAYKTVMDAILKKKNLLPPSGAMAGIYCMVDRSEGVWKAPANVSINGVDSPAVLITIEQNEDLNNSVDGKSICAIRTFPDLGVLIWGAKTMDANRLDWRYINFRRTLILIEQSLKLAVRAYAFEPNVANTWITVEGMLSNFLTNLWKEGALNGSKAEDAFSVSIGLGSTMTANDILEGRMLISVKVAISKPAEFIVITFEQLMQKS